MFEAIQFGPFILWTHLFFLLLGIWLSAEFFLRLALSANFSLQQFRDDWWQYLLAMLLGGRLLAILAEYRIYLKDPLRTVILSDGNMSFLGMGIGVALVIYFHTRGSRATFLQWLDVLLPALTFGQCFDWLGKFAAGQAYGRPSDVFWAVTYESATVRYTVPVHPVQLYYALFFFLLTFLLLVVRKNTTRAGAETLFGIAMTSLATMFFEIFRGDFGITVFSTMLDFILLLVLFLSLGVFAAVDLRVSQRALVIYEVVLTLLIGGYFFLRPLLSLTTYQLRFSQFLAVLALLGAVVYVTVHRKRHPHL